MTDEQWKRLEQNMDKYLPIGLMVAATVQGVLAIIGMIYGKPLIVVMLNAVICVLLWSTGSIMLNKGRRR